MRWFDLPGRAGFANLLAALVAPFWSLSAIAGFALATLEDSRNTEGEVLAAQLFVPGRADLITREIENRESRRLRIHSLASATGVEFRLPMLVEIPRDAILLDFGRVRGLPTESLILISDRGAVTLDPVTGRSTPLVRFSSIYRLPHAERLPKLDLVRDVDGDRRADLLIPDFDGYRLFLQDEEGGFGPEIVLPVPATMEFTYGDLPWYRPAQPYLVDMNLDGLSDVSFWTQGGFEVYCQEPAGGYPSESVIHPLPLDIHEEGLAGLSIQLGQAKDQSDLRTRSLYRLADLDRDGIADIVTLTVHSAGVLNKSSRYDIHMGRRGPDGARYLTEPDSSIESEGVQFGIDEQDFNDDGRVDFVVSSAEIGLGRILAALITGSFSSDLEFYLLENGRYLPRPSARRRIRAEFDLTSGRVFYPTILIADFDGDTVPDMAVQDGREGFELYRGTGGPALFAKSPQHHDVAMPGNPDLISMADLNGDGKRDIIIRYQEEDGDRFGQLSVLMAE